MIYLSKMGAYYWVNQECRSKWSIRKAGPHDELAIMARQKELNGACPSKKAAEAALKAHADKHKWKEIEP